MLSRSCSLLNAIRRKTNGTIERNTIEELAGLITRKHSSIFLLSSEKCHLKQLLLNVQEKYLIINNKNVAQRIVWCSCRCSSTRHYVRFMSSESRSKGTTTTNKLAASDEKVSKSGGSEKNKEIIAESKDILGIVKIRPLNVEPTEEKMDKKEKKEKQAQEIELSKEERKGLYYFCYY